MIGVIAVATHSYISLRLATPQRTAVYWIAVGCILLSATTSSIIEVAKLAERAARTPAANKEPASSTAPDVPGARETKWRDQPAPRGKDDPPRNGVGGGSEPGSVRTLDRTLAPREMVWPPFEPLKIGVSQAIREESKPRAEERASNAEPTDSWPSTVILLPSVTREKSAVSSGSAQEDDSYSGELTTVSYPIDTTPNVSELRVIFTNTSSRKVVVHGLRTRWQDVAATGEFDERTDDVIPPGGAACSRHRHRPVSRS